MVSVVNIAPAARPAITFRTHAEAWLERYLSEGGHDGQGGRAGQGYRSILDAHLLPWLGDRELGSITRAEYREWFKALKTRTTRRGRRIAPRTVRNIHRLCSTIFAGAVDDELLVESPIRLGARELPAQRDADPAWRPSARFARHEIVALTTDERVPELRRVTIALAYFLAGRIGEVSALRWSSWDPEWDGPLGRLVISHAYSTTDRVMRPTKTGVAAERPVHLHLRAVLEHWYEHGYQKAFAERPEPGDLIVPGSQDVDGTLLPLRSDTAGRWVAESCASLNLRRRTSHALRASLITHAQDDGIPRELIREVTHPCAADVFSGYTRFSWDERVRAWSKLELTKKR